MLNALVLADGPIEYHALLRVSDGAPQRCLAQSDSLRGDQDAFGIQPVQYVVETSAFFADSVLLWNDQAVNKHLIGVHALATHLVDLMHHNMFAIQARVEQAQAVRRTLYVLGRRRACQNQHLRGDLRG